MLLLSPLNSFIMESKSDINILDTLEEMLLGDSKKVVDFRTFVTSEDYCDNPDIYEWWFQQFDSVDESITELLLDGSIGSGKSTLGVYYFAYRVYLLLVRGNPQRQLGLPENSDIYGLYFSVNLTTAKASGYALLYNIFHDCKWFRENCPIDTDLKSEIHFIDKHFIVKFASNFAHQLSLNVWGFILDEGNFRNGVGKGMADEYAEVTELYQQLLDRQMSRFSRSDGTVDGLAILISSASYQTSFSETRKELMKDAPTFRYITGVKYLITPWKYSSETFKVFIGAGTVSPCIITSDEQQKMVMKNAGLLGTGQEELFIRNVPMNLKTLFDTNIVLALQNHCGVPSNMTSGFITNMSLLYDSYVDNIKPILQSFELEASTADDTELIEYLIQDNIEFADRPHSLFLDLSTNGDTGALCCYRYDGLINGLDIHTRLFSLQIIPPHFPYSTNIGKVKRFILSLSQFINIASFASDQFQSEQLRQELQEELGLENIRISIDSSDQPHLHYIRALVEQRIRQTKDDKFKQECQEAVHDWKKHRVVKAKGSSDDVMHANVGAFFLSDVFGKNAGNISGLYGSGTKINLVGGKSLTRIQKELGYSH